MERNQLVPQDITAHRRDKIEPSVQRLKCRTFWMKELSSRKDGVSTFLDRVQFEGENYLHAVNVPNYLGNLEKQIKSYLYFL